MCCYDLVSKIESRDSNLSLRTRFEGASGEGEMHKRGLGEAAVSPRERHCARLTLVIFALLFLLPWHAFAAPPPDAELTYQEWFEHLQQPTGLRMPCCSVADCHFATSRTTKNGYEVAIKDSWVAVPSNDVLQESSNPTGRAVICYREVVNPATDRTDIMIFCFVRPPES